MAAASLLPDTKGAEQKASDLGADSTRIAWAFLSQYYSFLNKDPSRLHCFYTKRSTLIHSTEGDDVVPCYGQQEIHAKIMELAFEDCKVYISNVDSQSSAEGGIIVQVLGEQSNRGGSWRKFSQTFFLAEQPNGYFVLNDICRFLKEEGVEEDAQAIDATVEQSTANTDALFDDASFPPPSDSFHQNGAAQATAEIEVEHEPIAQAFGEFKADEQAAPLPNGVHDDEPKPATDELPSTTEDSVVAESELQIEKELVIEDASEQQQAELAPKSQAESEEEKQATPNVATDVQEQEQEKTEELIGLPEPSSAPPPVAAPAQESKTAEPASAPTPAVEQRSPAPTPAPAPAPATAPAPAAPKSWASLAASNVSKWGSQATEKKGIVTAAPPPPAPAPATERSAPASTARPLIEAVLSINTPHCFVKGVVETIPDKALRDLLTSRFGPMREFDIIRSKACAFIEFERVDSARRAIQASMRPSEGGEGGILMPPNSMIHVVERKSPGDRPASRPRGGGSTGEDRAGAGRGPYRGTNAREGGSNGSGGTQRTNTAGGEDGASRGAGAGRGGSKASRGARSGAGSTKAAK